ncbi:urea ABC transporter ATP-binding subunit UrtE [Halomonas profundus]|jgi:urea transport system ATP-binding protein|uniref:ABC transporter, urea, ATP-binding protein, UrtE n=1 Tax=Vreelandella titanicae BH1 TaxID=1204738 RepID=L9UDJ8_9GAMM|nr:urea ABC transporter ATP-binding subunit UrtE [Halomonas titanicae]UEQ03934.1 urea ABC transporter ATP-binding subunit UrtE [Halomonas profundus]ELY22711.1 ABC transporter, urea, ATP-binding protein, UrtE [Halomonas titanicae BH1]NVE88975.1 urea ABC transporter ATP-binding subunit UrtE [Halomonas titanicae]QNU63948.1 urea ABC transporter ATP-binding subunit UrtE [Halomonas titanicae]SDI79405.1 amino acid/amide ABC transporter ATP-binding protein 2, HAAT family (TC 3.A.1.4.-) [Halomonas tita|tara:strand:- start:20 stop:727 length:708 start_codon:yes stop_codon:yes gene_type:complete
MLAIEKLNQFYGESHTLWDLDLEVPAGQCTCVMGRNGVGKTTLLKAVMGEVAIKSGELRYTAEAGEIELTKKAVEARSRLGIGYVPQGRQIFPLLTVEENLRTGLAARSDGLKKIPERVYELFPVLKEMKHRRGGDLSGGQQQQLAIGRALVIEPKLLILDEPGEGIQPNIVAQIGQVIRQLINEDGLTVLLVEQKLPFARKYADRFVIMDRGRPVAKGEISELSNELIKQHLTV